MEKDGLIERYVTSVEWLRELFSDMDDLGGVEKVMGIRDWDDACCVAFGGKKLVVSADGPYCERIAFRSALIHATTDVVVKGAKPLFAVDTLMGKRAEVEEIATSLKRQALALEIPILGGNTKFGDVTPQVTVTVVGALMIDEPIRDSGAQQGDIVCLLGDPIWGDEAERIEKAKTLFSCWFDILKKGVTIHAAKDVTKGGLVSVVYELEQKSNVEIKLNDEIPYPMTRNLDNFIICLGKKELGKVKELCGERDCRIEEIATITESGQESVSPPLQ